MVPWHTYMSPAPCAAGR